jgi:hypothetical protein
MPCGPNPFFRCLLGTHLRLPPASPTRPDPQGAPLDEVFNKAPKKVKEWGPFGLAAEALNGRLAMIGIALLLFFEGAGSSAFFM